jgi:predicted SnoaL-like aldol condensation-catalyzing enzyme
MRTFITRRRLGLAAFGGLATAALAPGAAHAEGSGGHSQARLRRNKRTAVAFYELAFNEGKPREAVDRFAGPEYIQHNPLFADGTDAFIAAVTDFKEANPELHVDIRTVIAEGDRVLTHSLLTLNPDDLGMVAADIFRINPRTGRIVEHWDVVQPFPEESVNDHPMF